MQTSLDEPEATRRSTANYNFLVNSGKPPEGWAAGIV
jgi:hypothetical protein